MKKHYILIVILSIIMVSCCDDPVEIARFELKTGEKELIPYVLNDKITFVHSNGYEFDFSVKTADLKWLEHHDFCEWGCCGKEYFSYQVKTVELESSYPLINISLNLGCDYWNEYYPKVMSVALNRNSLSLIYDNDFKFVCDTITKAERYDSLLIGNILYYNVIEKKFSGNYFADSTVLAPQFLFYNSSSGILQIKMTNEETFTIKN